MAKRIITISREFGSGGRFIGEEVAKKLGIAYYDKEMIGQIAEQAGLSSEYVRENAELSPKKGWFAYAFSGRDITGKSVEDVLHLCISDIRVRKGYREEEKSLKKWTSFILILIIALNLAGCSNRNVNRNLQNKPDITGTVLEVQDNSILLEINKEGYPDGTRCKVSLNEKNRDNYAEVSVGDEVVVYYDGKIAESDPLQINTVYGITLKNSVD